MHSSFCALATHSLMAASGPWSPQPTFHSALELPLLPPGPLPPCRCRAARPFLFTLRLITARTL